MGLRKIMTVKEPCLHKVCRPVEKFDGKLHRLLDDMKETLAEANGVGLAAPQVGILRRVVVVDTGEEMLELVNPELLETALTHTSYANERAASASPASTALSSGPTTPRSGPMTGTAMNSR